MADLIKILIFLSGSAVIGFILGRRSRNSDVAVHEHLAEEQRRAYTEVKSKLDRCTAKRAGLERELAQGQTAKSPTKSTTKSPAKPVAKPSSSAKTTTSPAPKSKAPIPPKKDTKKAKPQAANSKQDEAIKRVQAKADQINFDRIGRASANEKDDLKRIKGVGPFLEKKLNALGIYTFAQIAKFTDEDKEAVNDAIEFFPGRISRDNWVDQAKTLQQQKA